MIRRAIACCAPLAATLAVTLPSSAALAELKPGASAPVFTTQSALGGKPETFSLAKALKKGPVVVYFFPAAFTSGCTVETKAFADAMPAFKKAGATVIGLSADPIEKLQKFSVEACRSQFPVGVATPATISGYDVALGKGAMMTNRTSYVIAPDGKIIFALNQMNPVGHVEGTLKAAQDWKAKRRG